jgi:hypothetical protein
LAPEKLVASRTIDTIWQEAGAPKVRLMKLDVEGFEPQVIMGAKRFLREGLESAAIIEVSEWCKSRCGVDWKCIYDWMEQAGFSANWSISPSGELRRLTPAARETGYLVFERSTVDSTSGVADFQSTG